jgi:hypothetical protein
MAESEAQSPDYFQSKPARFFTVMAGRKSAFSSIF